MPIYIFISNIFFYLNPKKNKLGILDPTLKICKTKYSALLILCGGEGNVSCWYVIDRLFLYPITEKKILT